MSVNYQSFKKELAPYICFSVQDARKHFPGFDRKRLTQWQSKNYIRKIVNKYYIFSDVSEDLNLWWLIANRIFKPSYISLKSALNYYGFIPEAVFSIMSITTKKTRTLDSDEMHFIYSNIKNACYFGYTFIPYKNQNIRIAEPEKAVLDTLYFLYNSEFEEFEALRFNRNVLVESLDMGKMDQYAIAMRNQAFLKRYNQFKKWLYD